MMNAKQELVLKKGFFLIDKYLFPKRKRQYLLKGFSGALIIWMYECYSLFGNFTNYKRTIAAWKNEIHSSERLRTQLEQIRTSPMFRASEVTLLIFSFLLGYLLMSFVQLIADSLRQKVFRGFDANSYKRKEEDKW
ncbi:hypothetical protein [Enterococcus gilvus]|uniref:hypothetical protein n=1 Tax=Enterococcus gilvus TaxID=160453 RepID=UPI003ED850D6